MQSAFRIRELLWCLVQRIRRVGVRVSLEESLVALHDEFIRLPEIREGYPGRIGFVEADARIIKRGHEPSKAVAVLRSHAAVVSDPFQPVENYSTVTVG
ncbi:hypothetical protein C480_11471 [Natrialba aegyptia DSM 13077]|uniref:Uncharacterized protein n=1 Tax=Natrialba aegyptia DSM 13077 TaxID=1227491 RepID=M0B390_9EURY|nr:hypothetical protein C480_11471 [Natrialba aegyptia DSM 13077]